jgi:hypothetical protein
MEFIPRLNIGGVIMFDEIHHPQYPGETEAFYYVQNELQKCGFSGALKFENLAMNTSRWLTVRIS